MDIKSTRMEMLKISVTLGTLVKYRLVTCVCLWPILRDARRYPTAQYFKSTDVGYNSAQ